MSLALLAGCVTFPESTALSPRPTPPTKPQMTLPRDVPKVAASQSADDAEHQRLVAQYGGIYRKPEAERYLADIVERLAAQSERPDIPYRLTLLNTSSVNAFALPSGRIYVTRGLLAIANDSAEIAAVIAHEMAHVSARHALARIDKEKQSALVSRVLTQVVADPSAGEMSMAQSRRTLASFSRQQELDADAIGIKTSVRAGFDPYGASRFLATMGRQLEIRATSPGLEPRASAYDFLDTHPSTPERYERAVLAAREFGAPGFGTADRVGYLQAIDGMTYGEDPSQGFLRGRMFLHPSLGFGFEAPAGFSLDNTPKAILGVDAAGRALRLDTVRPGTSTELGTYLASGWIDGVETGSVEQIKLNGLDAATAIARGGDWTFRLYAIRLGTNVYRMIFAAKTLDAATDELFKQTAATFRPLTAAERASANPLRINVVTVRASDSFATLSRSMAYSDRQLERFMVLNGFDAGSTLAPGERVKVISE